MHRYTLLIPLVALAACAAPPRPAPNPPEAPTLGASAKAAESSAVPYGRALGAFFALSVADVNATAAWYRDNLGFHVLRQGEAPNGIAKFALLEAEGTILELIAHRDAQPRSVAAPGFSEAHKLHGIFKVGLNVTELDKVYRALKDRGIPIAYDLMPARDVPLRSFSVRDAEGNLVQFFGP